MGWKREAPNGSAQAGKKLKQAAVTPAAGAAGALRPEDNIDTALRKLLPKRSPAALKPVGVWLRSECNVKTFADLEGAESWADEVIGLVEADEKLAIGARGIVKELLKVLEGGNLPVSVVGGRAKAPEPEVEEEEEDDAEEDADGDEDAAEDEDEAEEDEEDAGDEEEEEPTPPKSAPPKKGSAALPEKSSAVAAHRAGKRGSGATLLQRLKEENRIKEEEAAAREFQRCFLEEPPELDEEGLELVEQARAEMEVTIDEGGANFAPISSFEDLQIFPDYVGEALSDMGIEAPLPIQAQALPVILAGHDITGIAKTGSGKTLAYLLPAIVHIEAQEPIDKGSITPIALCLAPTRELVVQIKDEATKLVKDSKETSSHPGGLWASCIFGGKSKEDQLGKARMGTHIMAATPGRLMDHIQHSEVLLYRCTYFVLDEADRMLEEGFSEHLNIIASKVRKDRHMLFFSATWPKEVEKLASNMCKGRQKPVHLAVGQREDGMATTRAEILQEVVVFRQASWEERDAAKKDLLYEHCREVLKEEQNKILVFVSSKNLANELRNDMWEEGFKTDAMHGGRTQDQRLNVLDSFKRGETRLLVCTDVMGRGIDIPDISHVVIYDMGDVDDYVHRIGRTARGPNGQGHALTLFEYDKKWPHIAGRLIKVLEEAEQEVPDELRIIARQAGGGGSARQKYGHANAL